MDRVSVLTSSEVDDYENLKSLKRSLKIILKRYGLEYINSILEIHRKGYSCNQIVDIIRNKIRDGEIKLNKQPITMSRTLSSTTVYRHYMTIKNLHKLYNQDFNNIIEEI